MVIRDYKVEDCDAVSKLFFETVHSVNSKDYTDEQLFAWASSVEDFKHRRYDALLAQHTAVADIGGKVVGFASIDKSGELDLLFVDKDFQGQGIATALCNEVEKDFDIITTYASITAKQFFENRGYFVEKEQEVERLGVKLRNYKMKKIK
ncbi:MAG: GNAT family N-acetyltransferase [Clostridia bacterium]|nr:GNAT family N-acetyltransferase [Clostridia bacterium]